MRMAEDRRILVTGAAGFIGSALVPALRADGHRVVCASRRPPASAGDAEGADWRECDLLRPETLSAALSGIHTAYYLVHSMGSGADFRMLERRAAENFAEAAAKGGLERIVYLGGPAPPGTASEHLRSRLAVGEILRRGTVPALELRASMVVGAGGASWRIVRDLALRLPVMVLPKWLRSRTRPVALDDVVAGLVGAARMELGAAAWFDLPGPETLSGRQILERIASLRGRRIPMIEAPFLTPRLSALWLKLVAGTDFSLARELVAGFVSDLLPTDDRFWRIIGHGPLVSFDDAARRALAEEPPPAGIGQRIVRAEERLVGRIGQRRRRAR